MVTGTWIGDAGEVLGAVGALLAIVTTFAAGLSWVYRRTLGQRRERYERLRRLGTGAQLSSIVAALGEPDIRRTIRKLDYVEIVGVEDPGFDPALADPDDLSHEVRSARDFTECFFVDGNRVVQTISDDDETILAFSVTARLRQFSPIFEMPSQVGWLERWRRQRIGEKLKPLFRVRLNRTRFADLDSEDPDEVTGPHFKLAVGARVFSYSEFWYFGNSGHYQWFVFTASSAAQAAQVGDLVAVREEIDGEEWPDPAKVGEPSWEAMPATQRFRRETAITTYTVIGGELWERNYPSTFGPHGDEIRTVLSP